MIGEGVMIGAWRTINQSKESLGTTFDPDCGYIHCVPVQRVPTTI
jgi:hypothetical protein